MIYAVPVVAAIAVGLFVYFKHPAYLKLSAVKAEIAKLESEAFAEGKAVVARLKKLL